MYDTTVDIISKVHKSTVVVECNSKWLCCGNLKQPTRFLGISEDGEAVWCFRDILNKNIAELVTITGSIFAWVD